MRKPIGFPRLIFVIASTTASIPLSVGFFVFNIHYWWFFVGLISAWLITERYTTHMFIHYGINRSSLAFRTMVAAISYAVALAVARPFHADHPHILPVPTIIANIIAIFFAINGLALMIDAIVTLKRILRTTNATVVDTGAYALVRHPQHLAILMIVLGSLLLFSLPAALLACAGFYFWLMKAAQLEEQQLMDNPQTAETYRAYVQSTPALVPTLRSLKKYFSQAP